MTDARLVWIVLACILVAAAGVFAGSGAVAVFSDTETVSGSFSVDSEYEPGQPTPSNGTVPANETGDTNETTPGTGDDSENGTAESEPNGSTIDVTSVELLGDGELAVGETGTVQVRGVNRGNESAQLAATLRVDGNATATNETTVAPNETRSLTLTHAFESAGNYTLRAAGSAAGEVTVSAPAPSISVTDASVDRSEIAPNETVSVSATVENAGTATGSSELVLTANGTELDRGTVQVAPGARATVAFDPTFDTAGTYDLAVDGVDAGRVEVFADGDLENGTDGTSDSTTNGTTDS